MADDLPAECGLKKIDFSRRGPINPQSEIANPRLLLAPLAIRRGDLTQKLKFIEAFACPLRHCAEWIFSYVDRQPCFLAQKFVEAAQ